MRDTLTQSCGGLLRYRTAVLLEGDIPPFGGIMGGPISSIRGHLEDIINRRHLYPTIKTSDVIIKTSEDYNNIIYYYTVFNSLLIVSLLLGVYSTIISIYTKRWFYTYSIVLLSL